MKKCAVCHAEPFARHSEPIRCHSDPALAGEESLHLPAQGELREESTDFNREGAPAKIRPAEQNLDIRRKEQNRTRNFSPTLGKPQQDASTTLACIFQSC
jgi:hypothetical protein